MLPKILSDYLNQLEQAIIQCQNVYIERYDEEILTSQRVNLKIRLCFNQAHLLELNEFKRLLKSITPDNLYHPSTNPQSNHQHFFFSPSPA